MNTSDCHQEASHSVRTLSSVTCSFVCFVGLMHFFACTCIISNAEVRRLTSRVERYAALFHYVLVLPLFEIMAVWGSYLAPTVFSPLDEGLVVGWLLVHWTAFALLSVSVCRARDNHRYYVHMAHVIYFPMGFVLAVHHAMHARLASDAVAYWTLVLSTALAIMNVPRALRVAQMCSACAAHALRMPHNYNRSMRQRFRKRKSFIIGSDGDFHDHTSDDEDFQENRMVFDAQTMQTTHVYTLDDTAARIFNRRDGDEAPFVYDTAIDNLDLSDDTIQSAPPE